MKWTRMFDSNNKINSNVQFEQWNQPKCLIPARKQIKKFNSNEKTKSKMYLQQWNQVKCLIPAQKQNEECNCEEKSTELCNSSKETNSKI